MANKNFSKVIESANVVLGGVRGNLRDGDKLYHSISGVLKDIQRSAYLKAGYREVFAAVGVDVDTEKLTPAEFFARIHESLHGKDKHGKV